METLGCSGLALILIVAIICFIRRPEKDLEKALFEQMKTKEPPPAPPKKHGGCHAHRRFTNIKITKP